MAEVNENIANLNDDQIKKVFESALQVVGKTSKNTNGKLLITTEDFIKQNNQTDM